MVRTSAALTLLPRFKRLRSSVAASKFTPSNSLVPTMPSGMKAFTSNAAVLVVAAAITPT